MLHTAPRQGLQAPRRRWRGGRNSRALWCAAPACWQRPEKAVRPGAPRPGKVGAAKFLLRVPTTRAAAAPPGPWLPAPRRSTGMALDCGPENRADRRTATTSAYPKPEYLRTEG